MTITRFISAQDQGSPSVYSKALDELRMGRKQTHWIWFVLPQLASLGRSSMALRYGIRDLEEAKSYLASPLLLSRLEDVIAVINKQVSSGIDLSVLMGSELDATKTISSLTLFSAAGLESASKLLDTLNASCFETCRQLELGSDNV